MAITEGTQPAPITWTGAWTTAQTTASFTPEAGALLVALVCGSGVSSANATAAISDSINGTTGWVLLQRTNAHTGNTAGTAEVWVKDSPGSAMTVSATGTANTLSGGQLTVRTLTGALAAASQNGAVGTIVNDTVVAMQASIAAGTGNMIYGTAYNWDAAATMTTLGNTSAIQSAQDSTNGDTWCSFKSSGTTAGTATYGYSTTCRGMFSGVEIKASSGAQTYNVPVDDNRGLVDTLDVAYTPGPGVMVWTTNVGIG